MCIATFLHVDVCYKSLDSQVHRKASIYFEITGFYTASRPCDWLRLQGWGVMDQSSKTPDLAHKDVHPFRIFKRHLVGKGFATDADLRQAVSSWSHMLKSDFFYAGI